jgi:hypothetical protein
MRFAPLLVVFFAAVLAGLPCRAAERLGLRQGGRLRGARRKVRQKAEDAELVIDTEKDTARLVVEPEGKAGKVADRKLEPRRLHYGLATRLREEQKAERQKLTEKDLRAITEAEERRARAEAERRARERRLRRKRKIDLTVFLDW